LSSDEKLVIGFQASDAEDAASWGVALQEAIFEADEEKGYRRFGFLEYKGKRVWVVVTNRHFMWFNSTRKLADIQNASAFDESVVLADSDVTAQGEKTFLITERKQTKKVGEKVKVVAFQTENADDLSQWISFLTQCINRTRPTKLRGDGIAYDGYRFVLSLKDGLSGCFRLLLEGLGVDEALSADITLTPTSENISVHQSTDDNTLGEQIVVHGGDADGNGADHPVPVENQSGVVMMQLQECQDGQTDAFHFTVKSATLRTENVAKITLRTATSSSSDPSAHAKKDAATALKRGPGQVPRKALPLPPGAGNRSSGMLSGSVGSKSSPLEASAAVISLDGNDTVVGDLVCEVVFFQRSKLQLKAADVWVEYHEDPALLMVKPQAILARSMFREMIVNKECINPSLADALVLSAAATEADQIVQAVINIYASEGTALQLIERYISNEVDAAVREETLFRTNSAATKMCKFYSDIMCREFLVEMLHDPLSKLISECPEVEVDPTKVADPSMVEANAERLQQACEDILNSIYDRLNETPNEIAIICEMLWQCVEAKFGDMKYASVGGFLFLRFICPAVLTPDAHGICTDLSKEGRRVLTLIAKVLQNISNGVEFGKKEEFMTVMNPFIVEQIPRMREYFADVSFAAQSRGFMVSSELRAPVPRAALDRSVDALYKQLLFQRKKISDGFPSVSAAVAPLIRTIGVPEKLRMALAKQGRKDL
jgi:osmotically-inducible protein OsmY